MEYLLKASGIITILFLGYYLLLQNETFFKSNRLYFLVGLVLMIFLPLVEIPVYKEVVSQQINSTAINDIIGAQYIGFSFSWLIDILSFVYLFGVLVFSLRFIAHLVSLAALLFKHSINKEGNIYFVETNRNISPFSFFNIIVYNKAQFSSEELLNIISHEKAHILQWHSVDTILTHLLTIIFWFNPFAWFYKKAVDQNLEMLADYSAFKKIHNQKSYQLTVLKSYNTNFCAEIANNFYNRLAKKRIIFLNKKKSAGKNLLKYFLLIPLLATFVFAFNTKVVMPQQDNEKKQDHEIKEKSTSEHSENIKDTDKKYRDNEEGEKHHKVKEKRENKSNEHDRDGDENHENEHLD